jgi:DNA-directed RNA polymerase specialized sigma subunit
MDRLDEGKQALAEEALVRAKRIADRYARIFPEHADDFESAACWGAVRAASTYDAGLPDADKWDRWSGLCIRGEIKDFLDNSYLKRRKSWPDEAMLRIVAEGEDARLSDAADAMEHLLSLLPEKYRNLCHLIYRMGLDPGAAGRALGYSKFHGNKMHDWAIDYLRKQLA